MTVSLTSTQTQVDDLVSSFLLHATDWHSLAAMTAGGMAYRLGRVGVMATGAGRLASLGIGLGAEVTAFEMTNRSLSSLTGNAYFNPNLWKWEGQGGIRQGLLSSLITFGSLKGAGRLAQGENVVVQHLLQDTGMVLGHQVSGSLGVTPHATGSLAEQLLRAEATNLQLGAGMAFGHSLTGGRILALEKGMDLSLHGMDVGAALSDSANSSSSLRGLAKLALVGGRPEEDAPPTFAPVALPRTNREGLWMMSASEPPDSEGFLPWRKISSMIPAPLMDLPTLIRVAAENPKHCFFLKKLAETGNMDAQAALKTLKVETLAQLAQKDPEAVMALHFLSLALNMPAREALRNLDMTLIALKAESDGKALEAVIKAAGIGTLGNAQAVQALGRLAETKPEAVGALYALVLAENETGRKLLRNLDVSQLTRLAEKDLYAFTVLVYLVRTGNPRALPALAEAAGKHGAPVEPLKILASDGVEGALEALTDAALTNPQASLSLASLAQTGSTRALAALTRAGETSAIAVEALTTLAQNRLPGAVEALVRASESNPVALLMLYALTESKKSLIAQRAIHALMNEKGEPEALSDELSLALQALKQANSLIVLRQVIDQITHLAKDDPQAVLALNEIAMDPERSLLGIYVRHRMEQMDVDRLMPQAFTHPKTLTALAFLAEQKNVDAELTLQTLSLGGLDPAKDEKETILALTLLSQRGHEHAWLTLVSHNPGTILYKTPLSRADLFCLFLLAQWKHPLAVQRLGREAETNPSVVFILEYLAQDYDVKEAENLLIRLDLSHYAIMPPTLKTRSALTVLVDLGNKNARKVLKGFK